MAKVTTAGPVKTGKGVKKYAKRVRPALSEEAKTQKGWRSIESQIQDGVTSNALRTVQQRKAFPSFPRKAR